MPLGGSAENRAVIDDAPRVRVQLRHNDTSGDSVFPPWFPGFYIFSLVPLSREVPEDLLRFWEPGTRRSGDEGRRSKNPESC